VISKKAVSDFKNLQKRLIYLIVDLAGLIDKRLYGVHSNIVVSLGEKRLITQTPLVD
jgi:hypothetical protein